MLIRITDFVKNHDPYYYSASVAEMGPHAARITWSNALHVAREDGEMLQSEIQLEAFRNHVKGFGAWSEDEIASWNATHCNALFIQLVSGDMREIGLGELSVDEFDWDDLAWSGEQGRIYMDDDGEINYYLGN